MADEVYRELQRHVDRAPVAYPATESGVAPPKNMRSLYSTMFQERFGRLGALKAIAGSLVGRKF